MLSPRTMRGEFIRKYTQSKARMWSDGWQMIAERDKSHRALNQEFGYSDSDGTFGIGCKSHVDQEYKRRYDEIEARFREPYEKNLPTLHEWCRSQGITIFEYLFFDDIDDDHLREIAKVSEPKDDWELRPIILKARYMIEKLKVGHRIGEIRDRIDMEISYQHYANSRCKKFFEIRLWDLPANKAIFDYGQEWKAALNRSFENLSAT